MKLVIAEKPSVAQSLAAVIGATAVSYTHLDVYKRQVLKRQEMLDKEVYDIVHRNKKMAASDVRKNRGKSYAAGKDKEKAVPRR